MSLLVTLLARNICHKCPEHSTQLNNNSQDDLVELLRPSTENSGKYYIHDQIDLDKDPGALLPTFAAKEKTLYKQFCLHDNLGRNLSEGAFQIIGARD